MTIGEVVQLMLALGALVSFVVLALERWRLDGHGPAPHWRRLMFTDSLLVVAGISVFADAIHETGIQGPVDTAAWAIILVCHGALIAGGMALLLSMRDYPVTYRGPERRRLR